MIRVMTFCQRKFQEVPLCQTIRHRTTRRTHGETMQVRQTARIGQETAAPRRTVLRTMALRTAILRTAVPRTVIPRIVIPRIVIPRTAILKIALKTAAPGATVPTIGQSLAVPTADPDGTGQRKIQTVPVMPEIPLPPVTPIPTTPDEFPLPGREMLLK